MIRNHIAIFALVLSPLALSGGCPGVTIDVPGVGRISLPGSQNTVVVEVFNDTAFDVDPSIRFDDDDDFLAALFPSESLATGILIPGEILTYDVDCDKLGLIFSDNADQFFFDDFIGEADSTRILRRDEDYDCGDIIQFQFIGREGGFGVVVSVNGVVVD